MELLKLNAVPGIARQSPYYAYKQMGFGIMPAMI